MSRAFGQPRHAGVNAALARRFEAHATLLAAHRGTSAGAVVENTLGAVVAAWRSGADLVELDVAETADGDYVAFHDGYEPWHFGTGRRITTMTTAEVGQLAYRHRTAPPLHRVEGLEHVLSHLPDVTLNLDRSWRYWPRLLHRLDDLAITDQLLLKVAADDARALAAARGHATKYPLLPIVRSVEELAAVLEVVDDPDLNLVGVELVTAEADHPFCRPGHLARLRGRGLLVYLDALDLGNGVDVCAGWDDTASVLRGPEAGWQHLFDLGADVVQTDWPALLAQYRAGREAADQGAGTA